MRVALVEDDEVILENYTEELGDLGFDVRPFSTRAKALEEMCDDWPDAAIIDIALGHERDGGLLLCAELRQRSDTLPIIFLTSHDDEINRISGLRLGGDDFVSKASSLDLLAVRIETLVRRYRAVAESGCAAPSSETGDLRIDDARSKVYWHGREVEMPLTQFWIVQDLVSHPGSARSHEALMQAARIHVAPNTISAHIRTIRKRFRVHDPSFDCIRTERGIGYRWLS